MIFSSLNSSAASSLFWTAFWAGIGGVLVLFGLGMEKTAEKEWYFSVVNFRKRKFIAEIGWWILMAGIVIEIGTAA
jgi:hypothetical protein